MDTINVVELRKTAPETITQDQAEGLADWLKPLLDILGAHKKGRDKIKQGLELGDRFEYQGATFEVRKHSTVTPWKKAYEMALPCVKDNMKEAVTEEVSYLKTTIKKAVRVEG